MRRALPLLTCGALLTLVVESAGTFREPAHAVLALGLAGVFSLVATVGFEWARTRGQRSAIGSVAVQLPLGAAMFVTSHNGTRPPTILIRWRSPR